MCRATLSDSLTMMIIRSNIRLTKCTGELHEVCSLKARPTVLLVLT